LAAQWHRLRRYGEKLIQRSAFVGLDVRERNITKRLHGDHTPDGLAHRSEQHSRPGVEQQRIGIANQVLVEGEAAWNDAGRDGRAYPEDPVCNLVDPGRRGVTIRAHDRFPRGWVWVSRGSKSAR